MGAIGPLITSLTIVYSIVYSDADQRKHQKLRVTGFCVGNSPGTGEFPAQIASNAENISIWWRHHAEALHEGICKSILQRQSSGRLITMTPHERHSVSSHW